MTISNDQAENDHIAQQPDWASEPAHDPDHAVGAPTEHVYTDRVDPAVHESAPEETPAATATAVDSRSGGASAASGARSDGPVSDSLFEGDLAGLRSRWNDVQAAFVDDPRDCVQRADGLVSDVVDQLTANFSQARTRLEEQWDRGEEASTEDLRVALQGYRQFFERLLSV